jgi:regulatory protein
MMDNHGETGGRRARRQIRPLDGEALDALALAYVARFATSSGRLQAYLQRKLRERGWDDAAPPDPAGVVARLVGRGYVDDDGYAMARGAGLLRRGLGARRIAQALGHDGIAAPTVARASGSARDQREAALAFARRRRLGPFGHGSGESGDDPHRALDPAARARQVAAMVRAGHGFATASAVIDAADQVAVQQWVDEADDQ